MAADAALSDERAEPVPELAMLARLQRSAFDYFLQHANPSNGLVADTTRSGSPSSIAVVGFALSSYPVGDAVVARLCARDHMAGTARAGRPQRPGRSRGARER